MFKVINPPVILRRTTASALWKGLQVSALFDLLNVREHCRKLQILWFVCDSATSNVCMVARLGGLQTPNLLAWRSALCKLCCVTLLRSWGNGVSCRALDSLASSESLLEAWVKPHNRGRSEDHGRSGWYAAWTWTYRRLWHQLQVLLLFLVVEGKHLPWPADGLQACPVPTSWDCVWTAGGSGGCSL